VRKLFIFIFLCLSIFSRAGAQEYELPLRWNAQLDGRHTQPVNPSMRTTFTIPLELPFFEDFAQYSSYPDSNKWVDYKVFINNTMGASPISRGVATFDALDAKGIPYDSFNNANFRYADSLTSYPINLSLDSAGDSVFFSFYYQPQGNGFFPQPADSLMLYFKTRYGGYIKVWSTPGSTIQPFRQVMIPITDSFYFHETFQFRFVNIAALYWADAIWNIDYLRMDRNRSYSDTLIQDIAFTSNPTFLLNDYTSMPYSQYRVAPLSETVLQMRDSIHNATSAGQGVNYFFNIRDVNSGTQVFNAGSIPLSLNGYQTRATPEAISIPTLPAYPANTKVVFENQYYMTTSIGSPDRNDTIVGRQVFDNYLAYDDGTAEKAYYLNLFPTLPGKVAIEFHLNHPDTMRGMAIYFGRQIPFAFNKSFSISVYNALAGVNGAGADNTLYTTDLLSPGYADTVNHFWYYKFEQPLILPAGTFYAGTQQCANCGADSLYFGLDVNRVGGNHAYYNVVGNWVPSLISGAIMMRPLLGRDIQGTGVATPQDRGKQWLVYPNPANDQLHFETNGRETTNYQLIDVTGQTIMKGKVTSGGSIGISHLAPGIYFINLPAESGATSVQKIIKL